LLHLAVVDDENPLVWLSVDPKCAQVLVHLRHSKFKPENHCDADHS
jgi:hypothetical protein